VSNTDSFIEEVTEEVRRDRLFALMRRYGWIALTAVLIAVGGAAWNEYRKASQRAAAEALGDAILAARDTGAPAEALAGVEAGTPAGAALVALLRADALADAGDTQAALAVLDGVDAAAGQVYAQLAALKALILRGPDMDPAQRVAALAPYAAPGQPFRLVALEQQALAQVEAGEIDAAVETLRDILDAAETTPGLRQRATQMIVALGADPAEA